MIKRFRCALSKLVRKWLTQGTSGVCEIEVWSVVSKTWGLEIQIEISLGLVIPRG